MNKCNPTNRITQPTLYRLAALVVTVLGPASSLAQGTAYAC
ncbi:MAG: hypothetical protein ACKVS9_01140 [Phycisphaerae bacterium]